MKQLFKGALVVLLAMGLMACGAVGSPNQTIIKQAIAQQINLIQQNIGQQLSTDPLSLPTISIDHVKITRRQSLPINQQRAYRIQGLYDATLTFPQQQVRQQQIAFELFLQQQSETNDWLLARPDAEHEPQTWDLIPLGG